MDDGDTFTLDESDMVESLFAGSPAPIKKTTFRSPSPGSKQSNGILNKLFCGPRADGFMDAAACVSETNLAASPPKKTWGSPFASTMSPHRAMKTPGHGIPTPYRPKDDCNEAALEAVQNVLSTEAVKHLVLSESSSSDASETVSTEPSTLKDTIPEVDTQSATLSEHDDAAFLPDDMREQFIKQASSKGVVDNKENYQSFGGVETTEKRSQRDVLSPKKSSSSMVSVAEVQARIDAAVREAQRKWKEEKERELEKRHELALEALQEDAEKQLLEHGAQWNIEREEDLNELRKELEQQVEHHRLVMKNDKVEAERKWMEDSERERTELLDRISELASKAEEDAHEFERRTTEMITEKTAEMDALKKELEKQRDAFGHEKLRLVEATRENVSLVARIAALEESASKLEEEKEVARETHQKEAKWLKEVMEEKIQVETEMVRKISLVENEKLRKKLVDFEANVAKIESEHEEKMLAASEAHATELKTLREELETRIEDEGQAASIAHSIVLAEKESLASEIESLQGSLTCEQRSSKTAKSRHLEEMESERSQKQDLEKQLGELQDSIETERKERESRQEEARHEFEKRVQELEEQLEEERRTFAIEKKELLEANDAGGAKEKELSRKLLSLEAQVLRDKEDYAKGLQKIRDEHTVEIDEMLAQLDLVEAEHNRKYEAKLESVKQNEAIIAALGAQLAEASAKTTVLLAEREQDLANIEVAREEAELARTASDSLKQSLDRLREDHKKALKEEEQKREELCQSVKEQMVAAAEEQFSKANEHYVKLKHEYDATVSTLGTTERELKSSRRDLDTSRKEEAAREVETRAELARVKAALATAEANCAKKTKEHMLAMDANKEAQQVLEAKIEAATSQLKASQDTLAAVVMEKQQLAKEIVEMKSVCEELMAMVE